MYSTSKFNRLRNHSLIDRGTNRGVTFEDFHVLFTHPDRLVDVKGMHNHRINSIYIVVAG